VVRPGNKQVRIALPGEGSILFRDSFAVPAMVRNYEAAHAFINFLLDPNHAAEVTNYSCYANTVAGSNPYVDRFILNGPAYFIHPSGRNFQLEYLGEAGLLHQRLWQEIKSGGLVDPAPTIQSPLSDQGVRPPA
jgi:putrescine transport system substrate-binding protein